MKKLNKFYLSTIIITILILCITVSLPEDIVYKLFPGFILVLLLFSVFIGFPCTYIYRDFEKHIVGILASSVYFLLTNTLFLIIISFMSDSLHLIHPINVINSEKKEQCLYIYDVNIDYEDNILDVYKSKNLIFYEKIGSPSKC